MADLIITTKKPRATSAAEQREALENAFDLQAVQPETPDDIAIENLMSEFASVTLAEVKTYRVLPNNKLEYICAQHPNEFRFDDLRDEYGGGKFRVFIYGIEDGKKVLKASPQFDVAKPREKPMQQFQQQNNGNSDMAQIMASAMQGLGQMMMQGFEGMGKLIAESRPAATAPVDPMVMQQQFLQQMVTMKQLFDKPAPVEDKNILEKSLDMLQRGIEMGKGMSEVRGEASSTDVLLETVKSLGPVFMQGMAMNAASHQQHAPQTQHQPQAQQLAPPIPPAAPGQNNQQTTHQESEDMGFIQKQRLQMGLNFLVDAAMRDLSPITYAELTLDMLGDDEVDTILNTENVLDHLAQIDPRINNHKLWFESLLKELKELLPEVEEPAINEETQIMQGGNSAIDASTGESSELPII